MKFIGYNDGVESWLVNDTLQVQLIGHTLTSQTEIVFEVNNVQVFSKYYNNGWDSVSDLIMRALYDYYTLLYTINE